MQNRSRRSNQERTATTCALLLAAARRLFVEKGYAGTATPDIAATAGLTRGALYHHYADKQALFHAVVEQEAAAAAAEIERAAPKGGTAFASLLAGGEAYLEAMREPGRTRLLLLDAPAILGWEAMDLIDDRHGNRTLREGLIAAMKSGEIPPMPIDPLTALIAAAFDRAALAVEHGGDRNAYRLAMNALVSGLLDGRRTGSHDERREKRARREPGSSR